MNNESNNALDRPRKKVEGIGLSSATDTHGESAAVDLNMVWSTIKRGKWIIVGTCLLMISAFAAYTFVVAPEYEAVAMVQVERPQQAPTVRIDLMPELENEIGVLEHSGSLALRVVQELRTISDTLSTPMALFEAEEGADVSDYEVMERLQDMVGFTAIPEQSMIRITALSQYPTEAATVANVYSEAYRSYSRETARAGVSAARQFLESQLENREREIGNIEQEWQRFAQANAIAVDGQDGNRVAAEYVEMVGQRDQLEFQLQEEVRTLETVRDRLSRAEAQFEGDVERDQSVQALQNRLATADQEMAQLEGQAEVYYRNNPALRGNESQVPELANIVNQIESLQDRKQRLNDSLIAATATADPDLIGGTAIERLATLRARLTEQEATVRQLEGRIERLHTRINNHESRIEQIPGQTVEREQLARRLNQAERFYADMAMELQRTVVTEESELGYVQVVRTASVPMLPVSPNVQQNLILGLLLGLAFGIGGAFVRQAMNWQIYNPEDIQNSGFSLVGVIPDMKREIKSSFNGKQTVEVNGRPLSTALMPLLNPWSPITENYRLVRTNLQFAQKELDADSQVLMVTSPEPGDGKSTTAVNLAITIALSGRKVLLVDADLRRPTIHKVLGIDRSPGLAEMLLHNEKHDVVQRTFIENFYCVPAGATKVPPTELLDSERMERLIEMGRERCDVVIVDTPPVLGATDALVMSALCDAVLVVASANKTDLRALQSVEQTFAAINVPLAGVIFNRFDAAQSDSYAYRYGYGYDSSYTYMPETTS